MFKINLQEVIYMNCDLLFAELEKLLPEYLDILEKACLIESPTTDKAGVDATSYYLADVAKPTKYYSVEGCNIYFA